MKLFRRQSICDGVVADSGNGFLAHLAALPIPDDSWCVFHAPHALCCSTKYAACISALTALGRIPGIGAVETWSASDNEVRASRVDAVLLDCEARWKIRDRSPQQQGYEPPRTAEEVDQLVEQAVVAVDAVKKPSLFHLCVSGRAIKQFLEKSPVGRSELARGYGPDLGAALAGAWLLRDLSDAARGENRSAAPKEILRVGDGPGTCEVAYLPKSKIAICSPVQSDDLLDPKDWVYFPFAQGEHNVARNVLDKAPLPNQTHFDRQLLECCADALLSDDALELEEIPRIRESLEQRFLGDTSFLRLLFAVSERGGDAVSKLLAKVVSSSVKACGVGCSEAVAVRICAELLKGIGLQVATAESDGVSIGAEVN